MPSVLDYYRDLAEQLAAMPGGHANLRMEYFGSVTLPDPIPCHTPTSSMVIDGWLLQGEGALALISAENGDAKLAWLRNDDEESIAIFPGELQKAASKLSISPLGLALLALAMGGVDDNGRFKKLLPAAYKASKGLLLIAVCRLCG